MSTYQVITTEPVMDALTELQKSLPFRLGLEGIPVHLSFSGTGIHVHKTVEQITVTCSGLRELGRAWFLMLRQEPQKCCNVKEQCCFRNLEVMLDCSRNAVMRPEMLENMIRILTICGYTALQLYTEDTLEVPEEPYFGYQRGAYTKEEIQRIDNYCRLFGLELVPCIQTLAHINQITRYPRYDSIIDLNDILLVGNEDTYTFLEHIIASAASCFSSRRIHIGMDEAHMVGLGKYLDQHGYEERFPILTRHLERVMDILKKHGFQPMMWSDMFFRLLSKGAYTLKEDQVDPALFALIPQGVELVYWDYYSKDYDHYFSNLQMHRRMSSTVGFAAGAWKWAGFAPENGFSLQTGDAAFRACRDNGIHDFMVTCWGDNGGEASGFSVLPCFFRYAEAAYRQAAVIPQPGEGEEAFRILTGLSFTEYMQVDAPNQIFGKTEHCHANPSKYLLYNDVLLGTFDSAILPEAGKRYERLAKDLGAISAKGTAQSPLFQSLSSLCSLLEKKADLSLKLYEAYRAADRQALNQIAAVTIPETLHRLEVFYEDFEYQWRLENKMLGFEVQQIHISALRERLLYAKKLIQALLDGRISTIEELDGKRLPLAYVGQQEPDAVHYNLWNTMATPGVLR